MEFLKTSRGREYGVDSGTLGCISAASVGVLDKDEPCEGGMSGRPYCLLSRTVFGRVLRERRPFLWSERRNSNPINPKQQKGK